MHPVRIARLEAGDLSKAELGRRAGLDRGTIAKIEAGRARPHPKTRVALARALGVPVERLWPDA